MQEPIRILFLIDRLNIGGTERQLLSMISRLNPKEFKPYLVCLRPSSYFETYKINCIKKNINVQSLFSIDGIIKLIIFARYLRKEKIDIIQTFFFDSTVFGVLSARIANIKTILSSRRDMGFWYTPSTLRVLYFINKITTRILVNSEAIKNNVNSNEMVAKKKIDVIYNGVDFASFSQTKDSQSLRREIGLQDSEFIVGIVANLNRPVKRVDLFISSAAKILSRQKNLSFIVVGEGHLKNDFIQQADKLGISDNIYFVGSKDNVIPYLHLFDVGVLTSESEGFSNSILEYMAAGLPVICFNSGGNREIIENGVNGFLIDSFSSSKISEKIELLMFQKSLMKKIAYNNIKKISDFSFDQLSRNSSKYYKTLHKRK